MNDEPIDARALWILTGLAMCLVRLTLWKERIRVAYTISVAVAILSIVAEVLPPPTWYGALNRLLSATALLFIACFVADVITRFAADRLGLRYTVLAALSQEVQNHGPQRSDFFDLQHSDVGLYDGRPLPFPLSLILSRRSRGGSAALARLRKQGLVATIEDGDRWVLTNLGQGVARRLDRIRLYPELYEQTVWKGG